MKIQLVFKLKLYLTTLFAILMLEFPIAYVVLMETHYF